MAVLVFAFGARFHQLPFEIRQLSYHDTQKARMNWLSFHRIFVNFKFRFRRSATKNVFEQLNPLHCFEDLGRITAVDVSKPYPPSGTSTAPIVQA